MITVAVLGPLEVRRDGVLLAVPSGRSAEVLVRLAMDAGRPVRAERIIDDLWGTAGRNTLQSKVSQLRRALGDPALIVGRDGGYLLDVDEDAVDALRVARLARDPERASEALALFRGELPVGEWFNPHRVRLEDLRLGLIEQQAATRTDLIGDLEELVDRHPLREGLWAALMTALHRAGRPADALAAYTRVRRLLDDELGVEPGAQLRTLQGRILRATSAGNLPGLSAPLVGRTAELAGLGARLADRRLVTLVGPAGVGKTRLAIEAARGLRADGGVWLVRLDAADATASIPRIIAETMQIAAPELTDRLAGTETVLVLDNCEHLAGPVAETAERLLTAAPGLRMLATSQVPLDVDGEAVHPLAPLSAGESVALFTARARESRRHFTPDPATVAEICRALDGLPLAIELAAARVKTLPVRDIARRLDDRFTLLRDPAGRRPALAAAIAWSYDLLAPDDQRGLLALSCFAGGASLAAAEHVLPALGVPSSSVLDVLGRLVSRSLVVAEFDDAGAVRYRLLDSIRAFAAERLGPDARGPAAHAGWYAAQSDRHAVLVRGPEQASCLAFARAERADVDAALTWCATHDPALGARIANGFGWTWVVLGDGVAGASRVRVANAAADVAAAAPNPAAPLNPAVPP
ncbi:BTAD domain-containing putative transcriptional regulator, partial [Actinoplanes sp. NPDC049265]|uniref:BTAD domain-containing putative transcriptional regulator n=1 Tax=Actinoplanes sp. NPDC049265 TaxID=3363902 RepID=UPI003723D670